MGIEVRAGTLDERPGVLALLAWSEGCSEAGRRVRGAVR